MRTARLAVVIAAFSLIAIGCGDDDGGTATTAAGDGGVATTTATTAGSIGGSADGSIVFQISGGYERSGEFPIIPEASVFSNGGWSATFSADDQTVISVNTIPGNFAVLFGDASAVVTGGELLGCSFELTQNDSSGFAGSFSCDNLAGFTQAGAAITVDFSGEFSS